MEIIDVIINKQAIKLRDRYLVSDTVNSYKCKFSFDSAWSSLNKTAVFTNTKVTKEVVIDANSECIIPWEVLADEGTLAIGVYGSTSTSRYPTIWSNPVVIKLGCQDGGSPAPPTPSVYSQLLALYNQTIASITAESTRAKAAEQANTTLINNHTSRKDNPHSVTKSQIGLSNVDNTSDTNKPVSTAQQTEINRASSASLTSAKAYADTLNSATNTKYDTEVTRLDAADTTLQNNINTLSNNVYPKGAIKNIALTGKAEDVTTDTLPGITSTVLQEVLRQLSIKVISSTYIETLKLETPEAGYKETYVIHQDGVSTGVNINIPFDFKLENAQTIIDSAGKKVILKSKAGEVVSEVTIDLSSFTITSELNNAVSIINNTISSLTANYNEFKAQTATNFTNEATARANADSDLSTALSNEATTARAAELKLTNDLNSETTRAKVAEGVLTGNLSSEITRAKASEVTIATNLNSEIARATSAESTLTSNLSAEETRAKAAEKANADAIEAEATTARAAEQANATAISTHASNEQNPHKVTKAQVGLSNVDNTSDINKPVSTATQTELNKKVDKVEGSSLMTSTEHTKLTNIAENATKVESSTDNGKIKINGVETTVYTEVANTVHDASYKHIDVTATSVTDGTNTFNKYDDTALAARVNANETSISTINGLIPDEATTSNQLADKAFVNSSISTETATFRGTYNIVTDLGLTSTATNEEIAAKLVTKILVVTNNDYAYALIPKSDAETSVTKEYRRFKYCLEHTTWEYEYTLNNSSFTADQWSAINSGATSDKINSIANKVDKETGKGLSTNDYTTAEKTKLSGIEEGANKYVLPSDVVHDSNYVHTDNNYSDAEKLKVIHYVVTYDEIATKAEADAYLNL